MFDNWLLLTIVAGLSATVFSSILRHTLKKGVDPTAYAWWFEVIRAAFFLCVIPIGFYFTFSLVNMGYLLALGFTEFVAVYLFMKMHSSNELSLSAVIMQLRSIWVPIFAFIFIGEKLMLTQWIGIGLIVLGAIIVSRPKVISPDKGLLYALGTTIVSALSAIILKKTTAFASLPMNILFFSLPSIFLLPIFMKNAVVRITGAKKAALGKGLIGSLANIISMGAMALAIRNGSPSLVTGVFQGITMLSVVVGIVFMGEKEGITRKLFGAAVTVTGILILI